MADKLDRESMSSVDRAWLGMDSETNLMIINSLLLFDEVVDYDRFRDTFAVRFAYSFDRFRQRLTESSPGSGNFFWEDDPYFDVRAHVRRVALPAPGDTAMLQSLVSDLMSNDLDHHKPLWRAYLIEGYGEGSAMFVRFHHCIADGIALIRVMLSMTDRKRNPDFVPLPQATKALVPSGRSLLGPLKPLAGLTRSAAGGVSKVTSLAYRETRQTISDPTRLIDAAKAGGIISAASAAVLTRLIVIPEDRPSVFSGDLGTKKLVVWSEPFSLLEVKRIGKTLGGTVNDVLIAVLTGALRDYMLEVGDDPDAGDLRAMVPVNLRALDAPLELGNQFGLVYLSLPISIVDPLQRLYEVKRRMDVLKSSPEAILTYQVLNALGRLPGDLATFATNYFATKASAVLTNVPGPQETLYMAGAPMRQLMFWVPQSGNIGLGLSIISYDGGVSVGIVVDEKLVNDPEKIITYYMHELANLGKLADKRMEAVLDELGPNEQA
jgi:diacylglycerol O-acyltransferase